jgi:glyoxylase-like metal-dependent hydrolase (beta-lactamase superfamily II)
VKRFLLATIVAFFLAENSTPEYSIQAIRYAISPGFPVAGLVMGAPKDEKVDIAMVIWLIRGGSRTILFDSGFHREKWFRYFPMNDYVRPDEAVKLAGVKPEEVTDIVISHAHWDHTGGESIFFRKRLSGFRKTNIAITREKHGSREGITAGLTPKM